MKIKNRAGPRTLLPWGTPALAGRGDERDSVKCHMLATRVEEVGRPCVELALDAIGREFGEDGRMPDCIESTIYCMSRDGPDLMSDIADMHPLLGE